MKEIFPGDRVMVWDHSLWIRDDLTPECHRPATVICRYGRKDVSTHNIFYDEYGFAYGEPVIYIYDDLVDVEFDHRPGEITKGHFTYGVKLL